jgi:hypothetical protein
MKRNQPSTIVMLTGGLGNQLFQFTAGIHTSKGHELYLDCSLGNPRSIISGDPILNALTLPQEVKILPVKKRNMLVCKSAGFMLRQSASEKIFEKIPGIKLLFRILATFVISINFKQVINIIQNRGIGFHEIKIGRRNSFLIGYFQSFKWAELSIIKKQLMSLTVKERSKEITRYKLLADEELPLVVHIRLGDYKNESGFGIPSEKYYSKAINIMWESKKYNSIWVFSDEPKLAKKIIGKFLPDQVRWIGEIGSNSAHVWEVMRFGRGFVIANSSFSWWAAYLAYYQETSVIAPSPWFKEIPEPLGLVPVNWKRIPAW